MQTRKAWSTATLYNAKDGVRNATVYYNSKQQATKAFIQSQSEPCIEVLLVNPLGKTVLRWKQ